MALQNIPVLPSTYTFFDWSDWPNSYSALVSEGLTTEFEKECWNAIVTKLADALSEGGLSWDSTYTTAENALITEEYGDLYAAAFNSICHNIDTLTPFSFRWAWDADFRGYIGRQIIRGVDAYGDEGADDVYPEYFKELVRRLNLLIEVLRCSGDHIKLLGSRELITHILNTNLELGESLHIKALESVNADQYCRGLDLGWGLRFYTKEDTVYTYQQGGVNIGIARLIADAQALPTSYTPGAYRGIGKRWETPHQAAKSLYTPGAYIGFAVRWATSPHLIKTAQDPAGARLGDGQRWVTSPHLIATEQGPAGARFGRGQIWATSSHLIATIRGPAGVRCGSGQRWSTLPHLVPVVQGPAGVRCGDGQRLLFETSHITTVENPISIRFGLFAMVEIGEYGKAVTVYRPAGVNLGTGKKIVPINPPMETDVKSVQIKLGAGAVIVPDEAARSIETTQLPVGVKAGQVAEVNPERNPITTTQNPISIRFGQFGKVGIKESDPIVTQQSDLGVSLGTGHEIVPAAQAAETDVKAVQVELGKGAEIAPAKTAVIETEQEPVGVLAGQGVETVPLKTFVTTAQNPVSVRFGQFGKVDIAELDPVMTQQSDLGVILGAGCEIVPNGQVAETDAKAVQVELGSGAKIIPDKAAKNDTITPATAARLGDAVQIRPTPNGIKTVQNTVGVTRGSPKPITPSTKAAIVTDNTGAILPGEGTSVSSKDIAETLERGQAQLGEAEFVSAAEGETTVESADARFAGVYRVKAEPVGKAPGQAAMTEAPGIKVHLRGKATALTKNVVRPAERMAVDAQSIAETPVDGKVTLSERLEIRLFGLANTPTHGSVLARQGAAVNWSAVASVPYTTISVPSGWDFPIRVDGGLWIRQVHDDPVTRDDGSLEVT